MLVVKVEEARRGEPAVRLVDDQGEPVAKVNEFLRLPTVREYSPNTVRAYPHDVERLFAFLRESGIPAAEFTPARAVEPQEGPCECDLCLTCAKFVTTPQYAPRLRERLCLERQLADDAEERGWDREVDRHQRIADRICGLLSELGEPCDPHDAPDIAR